MDSIFNRTANCLSRKEIKAYLNGTISPAACRRVEAHLLDCPLCDAAVEGYQTISEADAERELSGLEASLLSARMAGAPPRPSYLNRLAAVLLVLVGLIAVFKYSIGSFHERVFAEAFQPMPSGYTILRSAAIPSVLQGKPELVTALKFYQAGDFGKSIPHFENYLSVHPDDPKAQLLLANALLGDWQAERALGLLERIDASSVGAGALKWYTALALVQLDRLDEARQLLQELQAEAAFQVRARRLSEQLE